MTQRTVFFVSDHSGVTAETPGRSLMAQFDALNFTKVTVPFVSTVDKAKRAARNINDAARAQGSPAIVFSTLAKEDVRAAVREIVGRTDALFLASRILDATHLARRTTCDSLSNRRSHHA